jgi:hypothetical protein
MRYVWYDGPGRCAIVMLSHQPAAAPDRSDKCFRHIAQDVFGVDSALGWRSMTAALRWCQFRGLQGQHKEMWHSQQHLKWHDSGGTGASTPRSGTPIPSSATASSSYGKSTFSTALVAALLDRRCVRSAQVDAGAPFRH